MSYLSFVVLVVPALIGLVAALWRGPTKGTLIGAVLSFVAVLLLLLFQVTPPDPGRPGSETSRIGYAWGLMLFEWPRWMPAYLIGAAAGALVWRARGRSG
ncbi:MAG: hypothetical protein ACK4VM_13110 [Bosea sp. (in: a-proteobacteria)]